MEILDLPFNLTNWVLVGSSSPNLCVQVHIWPRVECSVVFGFLKAEVDELPKEIIEATTGSLREDDSLLREDDSLAPIFWELCCRS